MNQDIKELIETGTIIVLVLVFAVCCMLCIKWGVNYQTLIVFSGFIGTLLGVLGNKLRAGGNNQSPNAPGPDGPKA